MITILLISFYIILAILLFGLLFKKQNKNVNDSVQEEISRKPEIKQVTYKEYINNFPPVKIPKEFDKNHKPTRTEIKSLTKLSYEELLLRPEWRNKRLEILKRDNNKCLWCGSNYNLQVHHKVYYRRPNGIMYFPWEYKNDKLMTLCDTCHKKYHDKYKVKTFYKK